MTKAVPPIEDASFWDILVIRKTGQWIGFRAPWRALRRAAGYLSFVFLLSVIATLGWLLSRWQLEKVDRALTQERLKSVALETQLNEFKKSGVPAAGASATTVPSSVSVLPAMDGAELTSSSVQYKDFSATFEWARKELAVNFEIVRIPPVQGATRYYWVMLLHGPQGVLALPSAFANQAGEMLLFHRGQAVDEVKSRRDVSARFQIQGFVELGSGEPIYGTLLLYDEKGSLILKQRKEIAIRRAG